MTSLLTAAAVSGLLLGARQASAARDHRDPSPPSLLEAKSECRGKNPCKGQGGCKTDKHACKKQNACKGQGGCRAM